MPKDNNQTPATPTTNDDNQSPIFVEETLPPMPQEEKEPIAQTTPPETNQQDIKPAEILTPTVDTGSASPQDEQILPPVVETSKHKKKFAGGKIFATILGLFLLIGGVGAGVLLVSQNQNIKERAGDTILWPPNEIACTSTGGNKGIVNGCAVYWCPKGCGDDNKCDENDSGVYITHIPTCYDALDSYCGQIDVVDENSVYCIPDDKKYVDSFVNCTSCTYAPPPPTTPPTATPTKTPTTKPSATPTKTPTTKPSATPTKTPTTKPSATPTTGPGTASCTNIKAYRESWTLIPQTDLSKLKSGDKIYFCVTGTTTSGSFDKGRFKVNGTFLPETTQKRPDSNDFCSLYTIQVATGTTTLFNIIAQIHHLTLGWK